MTIRFGVISFSLFVVNACATSNVQPNRAPDRVVATTDESVIRARGDMANTAVINATPDAVYDALQVVYLELGVEVKTLDPASRVVGNKRFQKMYRLGGSSLDTYMGCGLSATGPVANNSRLTMSLISQVVPATAGSELRTVLTGYAEDLSVSKGSMSCTSTGKLEERIQQSVRDHLGK